jgi:hypothetical protein
METAEPAAIGLRVKTGRAIAVLLAGSAAEPRIVSRREIALADPALPETRFPYHAALELSEREGAAVVDRLRKRIEAVAAAGVAELAAELRAAKLRPAGVGLVVSSDADPAKLGNPHVRAHASEGRLFREVLEQGARAARLPSLVLLEREALGRARGALGRSEAKLRETLAQLGKQVGRPWRADEKAAALAAWIALSGAGRRG